MGSTTQPEQYVNDLPRVQDNFMWAEDYQVFMRMFHCMGLQVSVDAVLFSTGQALYRMNFFCGVSGGVFIVHIPRSS